MSTPSAPRSVRRTRGLIEFSGASRVGSDSFDRVPDRPIVAVMKGEGRETADEAGDRKRREETRRFGDVPETVVTLRSLPHRVNPAPRTFLQSVGSIGFIWFSGNGL